MLTHKSHFSRFLIWWKSSLFNATLSLPKICLLYACYVYYFSLPNYFDSLFLQDYHKSVAETAVVGFPHPVKGEGRFLSIWVWHSLEIVNWPKFYFQFKRMLRFQVPTNVMDWLNFFFLHPGELTELTSFSVGELFPGKLFISPCLDHFIYITLAC